MVSSLKVTFVVAVNSREVLEANLLASPCLLGAHAHQVILQEGFSSAAQAYNHALNNCTNNIVVFVHQDVFLPGNWLSELSASLDFLAKNDAGWGVLGCWGHTQQGPGVGYVYTSGHGVDGQAFEHPMPVQTLDEIVLIVRKSSNLRFDDHLPDFHFYGTDICMAAASKGQKCYAIPAFCVHNARWYRSYPKEFYRCYKHVKNAWKKFLPIQTSCIRISKLDRDYYRRRLREALRQLVAQDSQRGARLADPRIIMKEFEVADSSRPQSMEVISRQPSSSVSKSKDANVQLKLW